jgi:hypothetical protein
LSRRVSDPRIVDAEPENTSGLFISFASETDVGFEDDDFPLSVVLIVEMESGRELIELRESPEVKLRLSVKAGRSVASGGTMLTTYPNQHQDH